MSASEILRQRAAHFRDMIANDNDAQPWDVDWWEQTAVEAEKVADLLDAVVEWETTKGGTIGGLTVLGRRDALEAAIERRQQ